MLLCRFLANNKVYPDVVVVIESGINDILVITFPSQFVARDLASLYSERPGVCFSAGHQTVC